MTLSDILKLLEHNNQGIDRKQLYLLLFEPDVTDIDSQKVKNTFSKRPLDTRIFHWLRSDDGFLQLCTRIQNGYLRMTGNLQSINSGLYKLIGEDTHLPKKGKAELISSFIPQDPDSFSRFIALCILCANNNTIQERDGIMEGDGTDYGINLHTCIQCLPTPMEYQLWKASQQDLLCSRMEGNRFSSLNVIQNLLPKGYITVPHFETKGIIDHGSPVRVIDICRASTEHIAVVGDGGIGKTTFLHQIMLDEYMDNPSNEYDEFIPARYKSGHPVPFFIELNRCPSNIHEWRDDTLQKSNFITRYIGQMLEGHRSIGAVKDDTWLSIEKEFQRIPNNGKPRYLLLLDGFNEVRSSKGHSIRSELSNEITVLGSYPNVRIITTSRETQAAYFAADFKNIKLIGLEEEDILSYLHECRTDVTKIGLIRANKGLMECLRIPLNLCMFCAENGLTRLPETQGEIFYNFFHRDNSFYNIRSRAKETRTNMMDKYQTAFILDFILPFIGWTFEHDDAFSANKRAVESMIKDSISFMETTCGELDAIPYQDFEYDPSILLETAESFFCMDKKMGTQILNCIHGYLGILYLQQNETGAFAERNRYLFCHHQFRDYFSAMWDIQMLSLLPCLPAQPSSASLHINKGNNTIGKYINHSFWSKSKTELISQILMEHRNRPIIDTPTQRWELPSAGSDEQNVLKGALQFCRNLTKNETDYHFLLQNILSAIVAGRGELSGEDLHGLNFKSCNFFNIRCSRTGTANTLAANFHSSYLYEECFEPECHKDIVIDFLYHNRFCYTLDAAGCIKCWDIFSGKIEFELNSDDPCGLYDYSSSGLLKLSPDGKWLAVKIQNSTPEGIEIGVNLIALNTQGYVSARHRIIIDAGKHNTLNAMFFTGDVKAILLLCDKTVIYCYQLDGTVPLYRKNYSVLMEGTILYTPDEQSPILAFTGDYNPMEWQDWYTETYLELDDNDEAEGTIDEETESGITCFIYELSGNSDCQRELHHFTGIDKTAPTVNYIPDLNGFLFFNADTMQIEFFNCADGSTMEMFPGIIQENNTLPTHFHPHLSHPGECYIMYPDICYLVDLKHPDNSGIVMKYNIDGVSKLLPEGNAENELYFKTSVAPVNGRFIVTNDTFVYEWDSENDFLSLKYNVAYYEVTDLICDARHDNFILVHQNNGLSIFGGNEIKLKNSITFHEEGYHLTMSCLEPETHVLALTFSRPDHEKILLLNLDSGIQNFCFSTQQPSETILSCSFHQSGKFLLIVTQYSCYEYEPSKNRLWNIVSAGAGERCVGGNYSNDDIEIAIVPHHREDEKHTKPKCIRYRRSPYRDTMNYKTQGYYLLPELTEKLYQGFVFQCYDYGVEGTADEHGMQDYWVTRGFFYPPEDGILSFELPELQYFDSDGKPRRKIHKILPLQMIYFRHAHALQQRYRQYSTGSYISYAYLDEDTNETVFMENAQNLFYCPDYKNTSYREIWHEYEKKTGSYKGEACWSWVIPWNGNRLICCYENFQLAVLDAAAGNELELIDYTPGIAVFGCDFRNAVLESELEEELKRNGGRV